MGAKSPLTSIKIVTRRPPFSEVADNVRNLVQRFLSLGGVAAFFDRHRRVTARRCNVPMRGLAGRFLCVLQRVLDTDHGPIENRARR